MKYIINLYNTVDAQAVADRLGITGEVLSNLKVIHVEDPTQEQVDTWLADSDVKAIYENNIIRGENLDLFFKDNYGEMYNNIEFSNNDSKVLADKIFFDLANGDIKINMYNDNNKVSIIKN